MNTPPSSRPDSGKNGASPHENERGREALAGADVLRTLRELMLRRLALSRRSS